MVLPVTHETAPPFQTPNPGSDPQWVLKEKRGSDSEAFHSHCAGSPNCSLYQGEGHAQPTPKAAPQIQTSLRCGGILTALQKPRVKGLVWGWCHWEMVELLTGRTSWNIPSRCYWGSSPFLLLSFTFSYEGSSFVLPCAPCHDVLPHHRPKSNGSNQLWAEASKVISSGISFRSSKLTNAPPCTVPISPCRRAFKRESWAHCFMVNPLCPSWDFNMCVGC
jgi:hypothetical protein